MKKISKEIYLIRAIHEWCIDNEYTPYLVVYINKNCIVPMEYVGEDNLLVLDVSYEATDNLQMKADAIEFAARFSGRQQDLFIPVENVMSIFASEIQDGITLRIHPPKDTVESKDTKPQTEKKSSILKIIK